MLANYREREREREREINHDFRLKRAAIGGHCVVHSGLMTSILHHLLPLLSQYPALKLPLLGAHHLHNSPHCSPARVPFDYSRFPPTGGSLWLPLQSDVLSPPLWKSQKSPTAPFLPGPAV